VEAPPNFSVVVPQAKVNGGAKGLNMLYEGHSSLVRSRHPERALRALFQHVARYLSTEPNGFLRVSDLALVRDGRSILVPRTSITWMNQLAPRLNRAGWQFVDHPWSTLDLDTAELVVPPPRLTVDDGWENKISTGHSKREPDAIGPGRYPLTGWGVFSAEEQVMSRAAGVAAAAGNGLNPSEFGLRETLQWLLDLADRIPVTGLGSPYEGDYPGRVMALDPSRP